MKVFPAYGVVPDRYCTVSSEAHAYDDLDLAEMRPTYKVDRTYHLKKSEEKEYVEIYVGTKNMRGRK